MGHAEYNELVNINEHQMKALLLLSSYRFDVWALAGSQRASVRAHVMSELINNGNRVPQAKAGVNALRDALYDLGSIAGSCSAHREDNFKAWAKSVTRGFKLENYQIVTDNAAIPLNGGAL